MQITEAQLMHDLFKIRNTLKQSFKVKVGLSRILRHSETGRYKFFRCQHDNHRSDQEGVGLNALHPFTITDATSIRNMAGEIVQNDIEANMLAEREDSKWELVCPTNLRYYCFVLPFPGG
jgi:hypothetical protein